MNDRLRDLGEFPLIARLTRGLSFSVSSGVELGPGDDAAVLRPTPGARIVATADLLVQDIHFTLATPLFFTGWRTLAAGLSDLAAMGAVGRWFLLTMAVPGDWPVKRVEDFYAGLQALGALQGVHLVGGDVTASPAAAVFDLLALGELPVDRPAYRRSGARPGDWVICTGHPGDAAAGLALLLTGQAGAPDRSDPEKAAVPAVTGGPTSGPGTEGTSNRRGTATRARQELTALALQIAARLAQGEHAGTLPVAVLESLLAKHLLPLTRLAEMPRLSAQLEIHAANDISDGVAREAHELALASGATLELFPVVFPLSAAARTAAQYLGRDPVNWFLAGGEDYELLLTVKPLPGYPPDFLGPLPLRLTDLNGQAVPLTVIGRVTAVDATPGVWQVTPGGKMRLNPLGYSHF